MIVECTGALKATGGRGLQPAMDFLIENEGKPVPDPSTVTSTAPVAQASRDMEVDDEEVEALKAVYGSKGDVEAQLAASAADTAAEAKVGRFCAFIWFLIIYLC